MDEIKQLKKNIEILLEANAGLERQRDEERGKVRALESELSFAKGCLVSARAGRLADQAQIKGMSQALIDKQKELAVSDEKVRALETVMWGVA